MMLNVDDWSISTYIVASCLIQTNECSHQPMNKAKPRQVAHLVLRIE